MNEPDMTTTPPEETATTPPEQIVTPPERTDPTPLVPARPRKEFVRPLRREERLGDGIMEALKAAILTGELAHGELYSMGELAARFGASRTPVREAVLELENRGLVDIIPSVGFRVTVPDQRDLLDMLDVREMLEIPVIASIAGRLPDELREQAERLLESLEAAEADEDLPAFHELDRRFHVRLVSAAGNRHLTAIVDRLREVQWTPGFQRGFELGRRNEEHRAILDAVVAGDARAAEEAIRIHLRHNRDVWKDTL